MKSLLLLVLLAHWAGLYSAQQSCSGLVRGSLCKFNRCRPHVGYYLGFGWCKVCESVYASVANCSVTCASDWAYKWICRLPTLPTTP